jgi:outer membrane PBP1 activator LpoA protein
LLPVNSPTLGNAANAVFAGIKAGYEREPDRMSIQLVATDGSPADTVRGYADAAAHYDIVIGPLSRSEVTAIANAAQNGTRAQPTVVLAPAETEGGDALPRNMLAVGLSIEEEARQVADWAGTASAGGTVFAISTGVTWQKRAVKAFAAQASAHGMQVEQIEMPLIDGFFSADDLVELKKRIEQKGPSLLFAGLDARQTAQLRLAIGADLPIYGTSQLNPRTLADWQFSEPIDGLESVRLVDIPWQLQSDHPAVMVYPHLVESPDQPHGPVIERLYALGIDAFRVAREIALSRTVFQIDGVTGKLMVNFNGTSAYFKRIEQPALYQNGVIVPLNAGKTPAQP